MVVASAISFVREPMIQWGVPWVRGLEPAAPWTHGQRWAVEARLAALQAAEGDFWLTFRASVWGEGERLYEDAGEKTFFIAF